MTQAKLIVLSVENKPGAVATAIGALAEAEVNLLSIFGWSPQGVLQVIVDNPAKATAVLDRLGIAWSQEQAEIAELPNKPGALHTYLADLATKGVNLRSLSGFASADDQKSFVVWTAEK